MLSFLAETSDDEHLQKVKALRERHSRAADDKSLFDDDASKAADGSKQRQLSAAKVPPKYDGLRQTGNGHKIQDIKELMTVPVRPIVWALTEVR